MRVKEIVNQGSEHYFFKRQYDMPGRLALPLAFEHPQNYGLQSFSMSQPYI